MYMLIYFLKGSLPWQNLKADPAYDKYEKILERKLSVSVSALTNGLAPEFAQLIEYTCGLHFVEEPDYKRMQQLLQQAARNSGYSLTPDTLFCWDYET